MNSSVARLTIRPASEHDAADIARLLTALGHPTSAESISERWNVWSVSGSVALLAVSAGAAVGLATLHRTPVLHRPKPVGRITALVVDARTRGQGVGRALVAAAQGLLERDGCGLLEITSNVSRTDAHSFYQHLGYEQTSLRFAKALD